MYQVTATAAKMPQVSYASAAAFAPDGDIIRCDWPSLRTQLLAQWARLSGKELDMAGRDRHEIAELVQRKYGISARLVENYLSNLERTLPAFSL